jgi:hypothetical protein
MVSDELDDDAFEQLDAEDTLDIGGPLDPLDEGYSPSERPLGVDEFGTTAREEAEGESLDRRLAREVPDISDDEGDDLGDSSDTDGELRDDEVGDARSGRLVSETYVADDVSVDGGTDSVDLYASDVGIDGAGASAEEAAVHVVGDDE